MNDRDCESCKKFSRTDPYESEGYCDAKRTWVDPQEGEDCKMHEFTLHSANKYKDGTPIMVEHKIGINSSYSDSKAAKNSLYGKCVSNQLDSLEQRIYEFTEEYDTVFATHAGKINNHTDALLDHEHKLSTLSEDVSINEGNIESLCSDVEDLQRKVYQIYRFLNYVDPDFFAKVQDEMTHKGSNFCGNCTHVNKCRAEDGIYACELSAEIVDPDSASCSMFEPPF